MKEKGEACYGMMYHDMKKSQDQSYQRTIQEGHE